MNWTIIFLAVLIILWIVDFVKFFILRSANKKAQLRADHRHAELLEALLRFEIEVKNSRLDTVERNSIKRYIATLLNRMDEFEQNLDATINPFIVDGDTLDLDKLAAHINNEKALKDYKKERDEENANGA